MKKTMTNIESLKNEFKNNYCPSIGIINTFGNVFAGNKLYVDGREDSINNYYEICDNHDEFVSFVTKGNTTIATKIPTINYKFSLYPSYAKCLEGFEEFVGITDEDKVIFNIYELHFDNAEELKSFVKKVYDFVSSKMTYVYYWQHVRFSEKKYDKFTHFYVSNEDCPTTTISEYIFNSREDAIENAVEHGYDLMKERGEIAPNDFERECVVIDKKIEIISTILFSTFTMQARGNDIVNQYTIRGCWIKR